jgi:hypothetical protein
MYDHYVDIFVEKSKTDCYRKGNQYAKEHGVNNRKSLSVRSTVLYLANNLSRVTDSFFLIGLFSFLLAASTKYVIKFNGICTAF